jgi:hypothetical protein
VTIITATAAGSGSYPSFELLDAKAVRTGFHVDLLMIEKRVTLEKTKKGSLEVEEVPLLKHFPCQDGLPNSALVNSFLFCRN